MGFRVSLYGSNPERSCPLGVISGHSPTFDRCPLYPQMRTSQLSREMSALCQKRTHAPQQFSSLFGHRVDHSSAAAAVICSELFVESVLDEVIQHPVGLKRRRGIKLGDVLHHSFFFGKGVQPTTKVEHLPVGAGAVHLGLEGVAVSFGRHRVLGAMITKTAALMSPFFAGIVVCRSP